MHVPNTIDVSAGKPYPLETTSTRGRTTQTCETTLNGKGSLEPISKNESLILILQSNVGKLSYAVHSIYLQSYGD